MLIAARSHFLLSLIAALLAITCLHGADFSPGNFVVYRVGTGIGSLVNTGNPVFLDEFTPAGTLVQSIALPTMVNGVQKRLIASGTAASEGQLTLSADGRYLLLPGYDATPPHSSSLTGTASSVVNRVIGRVDAAGNTDTSTTLTDAFDANNYRGVTSDNGLRFWVAGNGNSTTGGVRFVQTLGATASTQLSTTNNNLRQPAIFGGQLYVSSGSGSASRLGTVGTGLPITATQTITPLPGYPVNLSPNAFVLLDLDAGIAGVDTLYIADDNTTAGGLLKYSFNGTTWTARGSAGAAADLYRGLTAVRQGSNVVLYAVRKGGGAAAGGGEVVMLTDSSGSTGTLTGTPTLLATAAANTAYRGIAFAPQKADLTTELSGPVGLLYTREPFDVQIKIRNGGGGTAYQVGGQFSLPSGLNYVSDTASGVGLQSSHSAGVLSFTGGTLAAQTEITLTVRVVTEATATYVLGAGAVVVDSLALVDESNEANNNSPAAADLVVSHAPDLKVSLSAPAAALTGSSGFEYTITAENEGLADASAVRVTLNLPVGLTFVSGAGSGFTASEAAGVVHLDGSLAANSSTTLTVRVTASADGTYTAPIGAAIIGPSTILVESDATNNSSTTAASTQVLTSDLTITTIANGTFQAGDSASYTITISNVGTGSSQGGVAFSETLPAGLTATSLSGTGWTIVQGTGNAVSATRSDALAAGQSYPPLTMQVAIATNAPTSVTSIVNVSGGSDANDANNSASAVTSILGAGPGIMSLTSASFIVNEEDLALSFELARTSGRTGAVSVTVMTSNGTATAGADYTALSTVIDFADNQNSRTVIVPLISDSLSEANETFFITLSSPTGGATLGTITSASVLILDPDTTAPRLTLTSPKAAQRLNEGAVTISGEVTDNKQVRRVQVKLNAGSYADAFLTQASGKVLFSSLSVNPVPGLNEVRVKATDFRGNESAEVIRRFTYVVKRPLTLVNGMGITLRPAEPLTALELAKSYTLTAKPAAGKVWNGWSSPQLTLTEAQRLSTTLNFTMVEGLTITANVVDDPFVPSVIGDFSGLLRADTGINSSHGNEGAIQVKVSPGGSFSGTLRIAGASLPFAGVLDTAGIARFGAALETSRLLSRSPAAGYVLAFSLDLSPTGTRKVTGSLRRQIRGGSEPLSVVEAHRHVGTATETFYTWAMPAQPQTNGLTPTQYPQGDAVGTMKLSKLGVANVAGVLADGTRFTSSMAANADMALPFFVSLEKGAGSLTGWMIVDHTKPDTDVSSSSLHWFKPVATGAQHYPFGWPEGVTLPLIGARFVAAEAESVLPDLSDVNGANALLTFSQGALTAQLEKELYISVRNLVSKIPVSEPSYSLRLVPSTGHFSGSFQHSDGGSAGFEGVILQKGTNRRGYGHFLTATPRPVNGAGQAGGVSLRTKFNPRQRLVISELMANNETTLADEDGAFSDWVEIYNPGTDEVDLTDWCLTDNASVLAKWRFPAVTLGARQFLLVWASSKNRRTTDQPLHTNFSLSAGGEYLALVRPDGVTVEHAYTPMYPAQANDESFGINFTGRTLVGQHAAVKYRVPSNDALGSAWTAREFNDRSWSSGRTGLGFGVSVPGFTVRQVASGTFGEVSSVARADALLALPAGSPQIASQTTVIAPVINYLGDGDDGNYGENRPFPNGSAEPFAFVATGTILIPTNGSYVFGLNSDDGGRIKIDGVAVMTDDSNHGPLDNLSAPVNLTAGPHTVEVMMWEGGGGDCVEFFAKAGTDPTWNDGFKLVGSAGGLQVITTPLGAGGVNGAGVGTNVERVMRGKNATLQARLAFEVQNAGALSSLTLRMRYNDGFVAWLNGTEVVRRNAPVGSLGYDSAALAAREPTETLVAEVIDLSAHLPLLVSGKNVLAIQAMNATAADSSFLLLPELNAAGSLAASPVFFRPQDSLITATPGSVNGVPQFSGVVQPVVFSQKHGFYSSPIALTLSSAMSGAVIRYTLDGSTPTANHGKVYDGALRLNRTSIVRAAAFRSGYEPTRVSTQSYFFLNDVIRQSPTGARPAAGWPAGTVNGQVANYGMDPDIVNTTNPAIGGVDAVKRALLALPTVSLVSDLPHLFDPATGIWVNPGARGFDWERPCSLELIGDDNTAAGGFQVNCGMRLRGGFSRSGDNPKHAFHFYFRGEYGASKLNYPLFGDQGVGSFDKIDLRTSQNYSWAFQGDGNNTFMREETARELQGAMGQPYTRSRNYHLYINGQYWGIFNSQERADTNHNAAYLGGDEDQWDVVKSEAELGLATGLADGTIDAWQSLWTQARAHADDPTNVRYFAMQGREADGVTPTADPVLLDPANLIDYMLLTFWTGNFDGATSAFLGDERANNWQGARRRGGNRGFVFYAHDFEHSFFNIDEDRTGPFPNALVTEFDLANPMFLHHDLRPNTEYRMLWADRVQRHLFAGGTLAGESVQERLRVRAEELRQAIIAESARWGDAQRPREPFGKPDWEDAAAYLIDEYAPQRGNRVLAQLREDGLYPSFDAPTLSQHGGRITSGEEVVITGQGGLIYYTLDGSDPRQIGGAVNPTAQTYTSSTEITTLVPLTQTWKYLADGSNQGTAWRGASFDDSGWSSGAAELGYGDGDETTVVPFIDIDPIAAGDQKNATTYFRASFNVADFTGITTATLRVKYDDAVVLYLNGLEVAKSPNISSNPSHNQYASSGAPDENAYFDFVIDPSALILGDNVLAAEIHQADSGSSDISFSASLSITRTSTPTPLYLTGTGGRILKVRAQNSGEWSALVEAAFDVRQASDMMVTLTPNGVFTAGSIASYTITAHNSGTVSTAGLVRVATALPASLTISSLTGSGWTISQGIATRSDSLAAGTSHPPLTLTVSIATTAPALASVTTSVSGGGEINLSNNTDTVSTPIESTGGSQILFSAAAYEALEESSNLSVTLLRTGSRVGSASVRIRSSDGSAKAASDYSEINEVITFADGEGSRTIDIGLNNDGRTEKHETFTLNLAEATGAISLGLPNVATARILELDSTIPTVTLASPSANARVVLPSVTLTGRAADDKGLGKVQVALNGGSFVDAMATLDRVGTSANWSLTVPANAGANSVRVRAVDASGFVSNEVSRSFTFVPLRPLTLTVTPANAGLVSGSQPILEVGRSYTLTAKPKAGFLFDRWTGPEGNQEAPTLTFTMSEGLAIAAHFAATPVNRANAGTYHGHIVSDLGVSRQQDNHGLITISLTPSATFSGTIRLGESNYPFTGELHPNGGARFGKERSTTLMIPRLGRANLLLSIGLNLVQRTFSGQAGEQTRSGIQPMSSFNGSRKRSPLAVSSPLLENRGRYAVKMTQMIPAPGTPGFPAVAEKLLSGTLARSGIFTLVGSLADGTKITASANLLEDGQMALFSRLDTTTGSLSTSMLWSESSPGFSSNGGVWFKPVTNQAAFPFGWPEGLVFSLEGEP